MRGTRIKETCQLFFFFKVKRVNVATRSVFVSSGNHKIQKMELNAHVNSQRGARREVVSGLKAKALHLFNEAF